MLDSLKCRSAIALAVLSAATLGAQENPPREPDVSFVPMPRALVRQLLELAEVGPSDVVYDLGSGDGRVVIMAAKEFGARGVGIEIDPKLVKRSRRNARKAGVLDRVRFHNGDLFEADIGEATVVTLYLLQTINWKLRPKLLSELRPGTRIVGFAFDIPDWEPEKRIDKGGGLLDGPLYLLDGTGASPCRSPDDNRG